MKRLASLTGVVLGLTALAPVPPRAAEAKLPKVTIIHNGQTITVALAALPWHLLHGDRLACDPTVPPGCQ